MIVTTFRYYIQPSASVSLTSHNIPDKIDVGRCWVLVLELSRTPGKENTAEIDT